ncbi:hypothetical protein [Cryptosporangium minutisporangium]|uniref:hypothetical protein n=1 Tax=Cryptosporangium minutisporangium TaxID=113569 RepID=UPI0031EBE143
MKIYTRPNETVVDFDHDPYLRGAAAATQRTYLSPTDAADLNDLAPRCPPISLVTLGWPRDTGAENIDELLCACRLILAMECCVIAFIRPARDARPPSFAECEQALHTAAERAGLAQVLQIVALSAPGEGDRFSYYSSAADAEHLTNDRTAAADRRAFHIDLLVYSPKTSRRG